MVKNDVIRAWKDAEYREQLSPEQRAALPDHPVGLIDLSETELQSVAGAASQIAGICVQQSWACLTDNNSVCRTRDVTCQQTPVCVVMTPNCEPIVSIACITQIC